MISHNTKISLHKFAPASELGPAEDYPVGSLQWAERISNRLQIGAEAINKHTVHHLWNTIKAILTVEPHPWEIWPDGHPFGTPDDYCLAVTGHSWEFLVSLVAEFTDDPLQPCRGPSAGRLFRSRRTVPGLPPTVDGTVGQPAQRKQLPVVVV